MLLSELIDSSGVWAGAGGVDVMLLQYSSPVDEFLNLVRRIHQLVLHRVVLLEVQTMIILLLDLLRLQLQCRVA